MQRTAALRLLVLTVICGAVLSLPGVLLATAVAPPPGCSHCQDSGLDQASGGCCGQQPDNPGPCGTSSQCGGLTCPFGSGAPAFLSPTANGTPTWQDSPYVLAMVTISSKLFSPNIFHPPEIQPFSHTI